MNPAAPARASEDADRQKLLNNRARMLLRDGHRKTLAQIELLRGLASRSRLTAREGVLAETLMDELLTAPDDFHHLLELRLFSKLRSRMKHLVPKIIDLPSEHRELRRMREEYLNANSRGSSDSPRRRRLILAFAARLRRQIQVEETRLYPILRAQLPEAEWAAVAEEMEAFDALRATLSARAIGLPVNALRIARYRQAFDPRG